MSSLEPETLPWATPVKYTNYESVVSKTVFRQRYLTVTIDEAQFFWNHRPRHSCALVLMGLSHDSNTTTDVYKGMIWL